MSARVRGRWRSVPRSVEGTRGSERGGFILECSIDNTIPPIATLSYVCAFAKFLEGVSSSGETHRQRCGLRMTRWVIITSTLTFHHNPYLVINEQL